MVFLFIAGLFGGSEGGARVFQIMLSVQHSSSFCYYVHVPIVINKIRLEMSIKDFTIVAKLGEGAYSSVYKVQRLADGKQYALKKVKLGNLSDKQIENAVNEVRILASINNRNVISYKEAFLDNKNLCIVMEFADGGDLYQKTSHNKKNKEKFSQNQIWSVLIQITQGLKVLHDLKIFHRDLKSANVFLTKSGAAKLGDMNVSKIAKNGLLYTQTGTPYYASPEVWKDQPYDSKSDIWSLGCVIYEMATLQPPFKAQDMEGLFSVVTAGVYPAIPQTYSKQLNNVIKLLLQKNPSNRPSADKLLNSSLLNRKAQQIGLIAPSISSPSNAELLKTIRVPKKIHYLTDRLPKSNYDGTQSSLGVRDRRLTQNTPQNRQRQNTLPRLEGIAKYNEQKQKLKSKQLYNYNNINMKKEQEKKNRYKNSSLNVEGISKLLSNEVKVDINREKDDIRKYLNRIHHAGGRLDQKAIIKGLPPLRRL